MKRVKRVRKRERKKERERGKKELERECVWMTNNMKMYLLISHRYKSIIDKIHMMIWLKYAILTSYLICLVWSCFKDLIIYYLIIAFNYTIVLLSILICDFQIIPSLN